MIMTCLGQDLEGRNMVLVGSENCNSNVLIDTERAAMLTALEKKLAQGIDQGLVTL